MDYRYGSHTVYNIEYHFVWVTKYRYKVLTGDVALWVREMVRQTCQLFEIKILQGVVSKDHVHILVSAPPHRPRAKSCAGSRDAPQVSYSRAFSTAERALLLGATSGPWLLLCHRWSNDRRDGARIFGASLRSQIGPLQLSHGVIMMGL